MAGKLHHLTVQDVLWLQREIARRDAAFRYAVLEEATFYQYGYGNSRDLFGQAGRFLAGFLEKAPFSELNEPVAVAASLAFLEINGYETSGADPMALLAAGKRGPTAAAEALVANVHVHEEEHHDIKPDIRAAIRGVLVHHERALAELGATSAITV